MPLNKPFYTFAIYISALYAVVTVIQGVAYFLLGQAVYSLGIFVNWYFFSEVVSLLASAVFLRYSYVKKFYPAFWAMVLVTTASLALFILGFTAFFGMRTVVSNYRNVQMAVLAASMVFGMTLMFSVAAKKYWLKVAGIYTAVFSLLVLAAAVWYGSAAESQKLVVIYKWASLLAWISPALLVMNFLREEKELTVGEESSVSTKWESAMTVVRVITIFAAFFLALKLTGEAISRMSWERDLVRKEAEWEKVWAAQTFVGSDGDTLRYQLIKPENLDPAKKYPMVVCLPYSGGVEGAPPAKLLLEETNRKKYPAFLFVPFCPNGSGWGGIPNYPTMDTLVFETIEAVQKDYEEIDTHRVYVSGVSRGGYGSWHFISLRPDLFAAAMPVCGGGDPGIAANAANVSVWAFHGEDDRNVPVSGSRDIIAAIQKSGGDPKYTEFPGAGHDIWGYIVKTPGVLDWMFAQKREP